jgi:hypothetical protein
MISIYRYRYGCGELIFMNNLASFRYFDTTFFYLAWGAGRVIEERQCCFNWGQWEASYQVSIRIPILKPFGPPSSGEWKSWFANDVNVTDCSCVGSCHSKSFPCRFQHKNRDPNTPMVLHYFASPGGRQLATNNKSSKNLKKSNWDECIRLAVLPSSFLLFSNLHFLLARLWGA